MKRKQFSLVYFLILLVTLVLTSCTTEVQSPEVVNTVSKEVTNLTANSGSGKVNLTWTDPTYENFNKVFITWGDTGKIEIGKGIATAEITELEAGKEYIFIVKTVDTEGNKSNGTTVKATPKEEEKYTVSFSNAGYGEAPNPITNLKKGDKVSKPVDLTENGWNFNGWLLNGQLVTQWPITVNDNITLEASWSEYEKVAGVTIKKINGEEVYVDDKGNAYVDEGDKLLISCDTEDAEIHYNSNGGVGPWQTQTGPIYITIKSKQEYGFYTTKDGYKNSDKKYINFTIKKYTVSFDNAGHGKVIAPWTGFKKGHKINQISLEAPDGWIFNGWLLNGQLVTQWPITITDNITLTASWSKAVPISIDGMGNTPEVINQNDNETYVKFGIWPQTKYSGDAQLKQCTENINAWDKSVCYTDGNGNYYLKAKATPYYKQDTHNDQTKPETKYIFTDKTTIEKNTVYYFKFEPIVWRVLTNNYYDKKLLLSEKVLIQKQFQERHTTALPNNYEESTIRKYLNEDFINKAFTQEQKNAIQTTFVVNDANSTQDEVCSLQKADKYVCNNTNDKIFLLSEKEATSYYYGFSKAYHFEDSKKQKTTTDYAKATGIGVYSETCYWWLRSPSCIGENFTMSGCPNGTTNEYDCYSKFAGVVPALSISF